MKIIICGAGQVGQGIAERLSEDNDVTVIDKSPGLVQALSDSLDVQGIVGHGAHPDVLERAGAPDADMIIAVTHVDEVNMMACGQRHLQRADQDRPHPGPVLRRNTRTCSPGPTRPSTW